MYESVKEKKILTYTIPTPARFAINVVTTNTSALSVLIATQHTVS